MQKQKVVFKNGNQLAKIANEQANNFNFDCKSLTHLYENENEKVKIINVADDSGVIKCCHSDILNVGDKYVVFYAKDNQEVYDFNIIAIKLSKILNQPVIIGYDGLYTSHQTKKTYIFEKEEDINNFIDIIQDYNTKEIAEIINMLYMEYKEISGREYKMVEGYLTKEADILLFVLGTAFDTAKDAVDKMRENGKKVGIFTIKTLYPLAVEQINDICKDSKYVVLLSRTEENEAENKLIENIKSLIKDKNIVTKTFVDDFYTQDAKKIFEEVLNLIK